MMKPFTHLKLTVQGGRSW